jgi:drug/metabolite transporter (DMT)-like permease
LKQKNQKSYLALVAICIIWGITWVVSKHAIIVEGIPPLQLTGIRQLAAGACFCIYFLLKGFGFPKPVQWKSLIIISMLMFVITNGLSTYAVANIGSGMGSIIGSIVALWLAIFGYFILKQKVNAQTIIGLILGFLGMLIMFYKNLNAFANKDYKIGIIISIIATVTWALGTIYTVKNSEKGNAWYNMGWQMFLSGIILTALSYTQPRLAWSKVSLGGWLDMAILIFAGSVFAFICFMYVLQKLPAAQASIYVYVNPIIAVLFGHIVFKEEKLTWSIAIGGAIILCGVYLVNSAIKKREVK